MPRRLFRLRRSLPLALAVVLAGSLDAQTPVPVVGRSVVKIHEELCANCHGLRWEGNRAPSMLDDVWAHGGDDESLARSIRRGNPAAEMPPFENVLTPQEIRAMVVFIRETRERAKQQKQPNRADIDGLVLTSELESFKVERIAGGLETPWGIAFIPGGRMLVTERPGRIRVIEPGRGVVDTISGLPPIWLKQDGGLLDIAVHPDFARNGWVYLAFSEVGGTERGASTTKIVRARLSGRELVEHQTLFQAAPELYWNNNTHFGARFLFDRTGYLYYSIGDRGHRDDAQDLASPYGKLHRVHDDGRVPADNPFVKQADAVKSIWSYGHRNQQGLAQHPVTGDIWATEHGARGGDELNFIQPARNYGWPVITYGMNDNGTPITDITEKAGMEQPVVYWTPSIAVCAIEFYTAPKFPRWKNNLFATALAGRHLRRLVLDGQKVTHQEVIFRDIGRVREVVTGPDGFLYIALNAEFADSPGQIIRLVPASTR